MMHPSTIPLHEESLLVHQLVVNDLESTGHTWNFAGKRESIPASKIPVSL